MRADNAIIQAMQQRMFYNCRHATFTCSNWGYFTYRYVHRIKKKACDAIYLSIIRILIARL